MPPPPPPAPPPPPPPPPISAAPPAKVKGRDALLRDIQHGAKLKKAVTNDRSAPVIDGKSNVSTSNNPSLNATSRAGSTPRAPMAPSSSTGPVSFADELNRRLGGGTIRGLPKSPSSGSCSATNGGTGAPTSAANATSGTITNGAVARPLPAPPAPSLPFSKPANSTMQSSHTTSDNGVVRRSPAAVADPNEQDDGRFKGPSVREQMLAFNNAQKTPTPPPPPPSSSKRLSSTNWSENEDGVGGGGTKAPPPPPPSKPPSKPPQKDNRFHTLNPSSITRMRQNGMPSSNVVRAGSHENLAASENSHPPPPPPKQPTARSPTSARPAPPPPARPPGVPDRPQVAPPPPPPPVPTHKQAPMNANVNSRLNNTQRNDVLLRNHAPKETLPPPPPRRESLIPDFERRFNFIAVRDLPAPEDYRNVPKFYAKSTQHRRNAPLPPPH